MREAEYLPPQSPHVKGGIKGRHFSPFVLILIFSLFTFHLLPFTSVVFADELRLDYLIKEALNNNHEIVASETKLASSKFRPPQESSLPDPMFMFGYQNEGWKKYTYGEMQGAQWMFSLSQTIPFPGKLSLKAKVSDKESEVLSETSDAIRKRIISGIKENYYTLFLLYKNLDLLEEKRVLLKEIEDSAAARYSAGLSDQQEVLMAQLEKYMVMEKEKMFRQSIESVESIINANIGKDPGSTLGRPAEPEKSSLKYSLEGFTRKAMENSPEIRSRQRMTEASELSVSLKQKDYYPDFTFTGSVSKREKPFEDMWSFTTSFNIPIFFSKKQRNALLEAESKLSEVQHELEAGKFMLSSSILENYSMADTADDLMSLYKEGIIPKTRQTFEAVLAGYSTGKAEISSVIKSLTSLVDYEMLYWMQFVEREKAIARLEALSGEEINEQEYRQEETR